MADHVSFNPFLSGGGGGEGGIDELNRPALHRVKSISVTFGRERVKMA